jgi:hypothetical protein
MTQTPPPPETPPSTPPGETTAPPVGRQPHRGVTVLVLGILGLACCFILGIIAWVMGNKDLQEMDAGRMDPSGRGLTQAGKICGMIAVIWQIIVLVINLIMLGTGAGAMWS